MEERWGTFSVNDHYDIEKLIEDVLLFDRLVFPVPPDDSEDTRSLWKPWHPEVQEKRLAALGNRVIRVPWNSWRREQFADRMSAVKAIADDTETVIPTSAAFQMTRRILAQDDSLTLPPGVTRATTVAAYHSATALRENYLFDVDRTARETLAVSMRYRLAQPLFASAPETSLVRAVALCNDDVFQESRRALYKWEKDLLDEKVPPERAIEELDQLITRYNECVKDASDRVKYNLVFTIAGISITMAGALLATPLATAPLMLVGGGSILQLVRFAKLDAKPVVKPGEAKPAAMFHEIEQAF